MKLTKPNIMIVALHRISPRTSSGLVPNERLKLEPAELIRFIETAFSHGFHFISLDEMVANIKLGIKPQYSKNIVVTLDDGYKDNLDHGYPIFQHYKIPFAVYITTDFVDRQRIPWWLALEFLLRRRDSLMIAGRKFHIRDLDQEISAFLSIRKLMLGLDHANYDLIYNKIISELFESERHSVEKSIMSWKDLQILSRDPLCTIGCHCLTHAPLSFLNSKNLKNELVEARKRLQENLQINIKHLAYPYGGKAEAGSREYNMVAELGYDTGVTMRYGLATSNAGELNALPRVPVGEGFRFETLGSRLLLSTSVRFFRKIFNNFVNS